MCFVFNTQDIETEKTIKCVQFGVWGVVFSWKRDFHRSSNNTTQSSSLPKLWSVF
uniref:Transport family protein n=1 Tax=Rhizophora mucronata TaxID=61149 RepID=A0A2P2JC92_RHIMU